MIINESRLNEVKSINVGDGATAYQYGGKYYLKKGKDKKEITADQFSKLVNKDQKSSNQSTRSSNTTDSEKERAQKLGAKSDTDYKLLSDHGVSLGKPDKYSHITARVNPKNGNVVVSSYGPMGFSGNIGTYKNFSPEKLRNTCSKSEYSDIRNLELDDKLLKQIADLQSRVKTNL